MLATLEILSAISPPRMSQFFAPWQTTVISPSGYVQSGFDRTVSRAVLGNGKLHCVVHLVGKSLSSC